MRPVHANDDPARLPAVRQERDGFIIGEVPAWWCWKARVGHPARRESLRQSSNCGMSGDAYHIWHHRGRQRRGARDGKASAGITPAQVDYINAHGTSTPHNDRIETLAIRTCSATAPTNGHRRPNR
jgi:3-oxoacyl-[acyl-carrier-protein] synthase II